MASASPGCIEVVAAVSDHNAFLSMVQREVNAKPLWVFSGFQMRRSVLLLTLEVDFSELHQLAIVVRLLSLCQRELKSGPAFELGREV